MAETVTKKASELKAGDVLADGSHIRSVGRWTGNNVRLSVRSPQGEAVLLIKAHKDVELRS